MKKKKQAKLKQKTDRPAQAKLFYGVPEVDADLLYFGKFQAPDAFIAMEVGGKKIAVLSALERSRGEKDSGFDEVLSLEQCREEARQHFSDNDPGGSIAQIIALLAGRAGTTAFRVGPNFPLGLARQLGVYRIELDVVEEGLCPERVQKNEDELKAIIAGNAAAAAGLSAAEEAIRKAKIKRGKLYLKGEELTSERLRYIIDCACLQHGAIASHTIAAGGDQACDPHCIGHGPLYANELIIVDVFPRMMNSGYHGDMTRTFLKGTASEGQVKLIKAVRKAQQNALAAVRARVKGESVHKKVKNYFDEQGFTTEIKDVPRGFFHSTGHGLGLEIHEAPRVGPGGGFLSTGMVVTIEPGLYYPGLGGCRIEDVVEVQAKGSRLLSSFHYEWLIE